MQAKKTKFDNAWLFIPKRYEDLRGWFCEAYKENQIESLLGIDFKYNFIQDNQSLSMSSGTIRGFHYQEEPFAQTKLVQCVSGSVYDVIVDLRKDSPTFGQWEGFFLTEENGHQLLVPKGFGHAICTLQDNTRVFYKVDNPYSKEHDKGIIWNDPYLNVNWPFQNVIVSEKDSQHPTIREVF